MFKRFVVALVLSVAVLLAQPVLQILFQPLRVASIHDVPLIGWVTSAVVTVLPLALTVALFLVIWLTALRIWKKAFFGLPGFRAGLSKTDFLKLSKSEKRITRALYADSRKIMTDAGLSKKDAAGAVWYPSISGIKLTPAGIRFSVGGVALTPGAEIERAVDSLAAAIPGPESLEILPSNDVRFAVFVLRTRDAFSDLEALDLGHVEHREAGSLDDFLGMED